MGHRAVNDAYYTPEALATECCLKLSSMGYSEPMVLEPCVGGGAWTRAVRRVWPRAYVHGMDLDPNANFDGCDSRNVGDFMTSLWPLTCRATMVLGNPPYSGDPLAWVDRARQIAPVVGFILRSTILGSKKRLAWWHRNTPARIFNLVPRPKWEGPGAQNSTDTTDSIFVVWDRDMPSLLSGGVTYDWLSWSSSR